jgi:CRP-like cAMP-binding protein
MHHVVDGLFKSANLFQWADQTTLATLRTISTSRELVEGERIFEQGGVPDAVYLIETGYFLLFRRSTCGDYQIADLRGPGDCLGEAAIWDDSERRCSAVAVAPARLHVLPMDRIAQIVDDFPGFVDHELQSFISRACDAAGSS